MKNTFASAFAVLVLGGVLSGARAMAQSGPIGDMWLTAGDQGDLFEISGGVVTTYSLNSNEYGIAVYNVGGGDDVRTQANISGNGYEYLNGIATGGSYGTSVPAIYDGAEDASNGVTYGIEWPTGGVYSYDQNWGNATFLFQPQGGDNLGITFDPTTGTLYTLDRSDAMISNYTTTGALLGDFSIASDCAGLAMDSDGTLWTLAQGSNGTLLHYTTSGAYLGDFVMNVSDNILGMEITPSSTPEPITMIAFGVGALALARRRKNA